jgi:plastocyanin
VLRSWPIPLAITALLAVPAAAADFEVKATPDARFTPGTTTVGVGDTVTWKNTGGTHNVHFEDGSFDKPAEPSPGWTVDRTFDEPGTYRFYCEFHGGPGGAGMSGKVVVRDPDGPVPVDPPGLTLTTRGKQSLRRVLDGVVVKARCSGGCSIALGVRDGRKSIGGTAANLDAGDPAKRIKIKIRKKVRRRLAKREKPFDLVVEAHAVNAGGDRTLKRTITVQP